MNISNFESLYHANQILQHYVATIQAKEDLTKIDDYLTQKYSEKVMLIVKRKAFIIAASDSMHETEIELWAKSMSDIFTLQKDSN